jgi:hypothetical protein
VAKKKEFRSRFVAVEGDFGLTITISGDTIRNLGFLEKKGRHS